MRVRVADDAAIALAARHIGAGRLVVFPTETVYGIGADAGNSRAVATIFAVKNRPQINPLIVHVAHLAQAEELGVFGPAARTLARAFWPGGLTVVVKQRPNVLSELVSAGHDTLALRVPSHPVAQKLLARAGVPVAAPSANPSGHLSPTSAAAIARTLKQRVSLILDGGPCSGGLESTIVSCVDTEPFLLRPGIIARGDIERRLGQRLVDLDGRHETPLAPGLLRSHYAPASAVRLDASSVAPREAFLDFGNKSDPQVRQGLAYENLSAAGDLVEAAANLFAMLRILDHCGASTIAVAPIPRQGLGEAINDRLRRAAAPRNDSAR